MNSPERGWTGGRRSSPGSKNVRQEETNRLEEEYGDVCGEKPEGCLRVMSNNINGLSIKNNIKFNKLKSFIDEFDIDIFGCQEVNVCWNRYHFRERLHITLRGWRESCMASVVFNTTERSKSKVQRE